MSFFFFFNLFGRKGVKKENLNNHSSMSNEPQFTFQCGYNMVPYLGFWYESVLCMSMKSKKPHNSALEEASQWEKKVKSCFYDFLIIFGLSGSRTTYELMHTPRHEHDIVHTSFRKHNVMHVTTRHFIDNYDLNQYQRKKGLIFFFLFKNDSNVKSCSFFPHFSPVAVRQPDVRQPPFIETERTGLLLCVTRVLWVGPSRVAASV